jgi:hypothetical protein
MATNPPIPPDDPFLLWLQSLTNQTRPQVNRPPTQTPATPPSGPETPPPTSGSAMAPYFQALPSHLAAQDRAQEAQQQTIRDVLLGQRIGGGGAPVTPANPTGNASNPWAQGGLFAGNPTNRAAQAIQAQPLWSNVGGRLVHGTNYPGFPLPATASPASETLPAMGPAEQTATLERYAPQPNVFTERGLELPPGGSGQPPTGAPVQMAGAAPTTPIATAAPPATTAATPYTPPPSPLPGRNFPPGTIDVDAFLQAQANQLRRRTNY